MNYLWKYSPVKGSFKVKQFSNDFWKANLVFNISNRGRRPKIQKIYFFSCTKNQCFQFSCFFPVFLYFPVFLNFRSMVKVTKFVDLLRNWAFSCILAVCHWKLEKYHLQYLSQLNPQILLLSKIYSIFLCDAWMICPVYTKSFQLYFL